MFTRSFHLRVDKVTSLQRSIVDGNGRAVMKSPKCIGQLRMVFQSSANSVFPTQEITDTITSASVCLSVPLCIPFRV